MKYIFDLKGSSVNRYVRSADLNKTLKDLNFMQIQKKIPVYIYVLFLNL